ncbi:hypothetical protein AX16_010547 [Volvariella volvacea WC 439]|nr:hypothetical protein AX16_010547 [Volvariella volvacea WC 439]
MAEQVLEELRATNIFDLRRVVAVVTGGGTGIGLMISTTLVSNGAKVYIIGPNQADLDRVANVYNEAAAKRDSDTGGRLYGIQGDVRHKSEAIRLAELIGQKEPNGITVLFNNAGILTGRFERPSPSAGAQEFLKNLFDPVTQEDFNNVFNTNAVGPYWFSLAFLPLLEKWKNAPIPAAKKFVPQIVMTSSMNGWTKDAATGGPSFPYLFSKSAIGHATSSLAHELLPLGIRVNGIAPGLFITEMSAPGTADALGRSHLPSTKHFGFEVPTIPSGSPRDMGTLALFLVANWFVNGETVLIDGGTLLVHPSSF